MCMLLCRCSRVAQTLLLRLWSCLICVGLCHFRVVPCCRDVFRGTTVDQTGVGSITPGAASPESSFACGRSMGSDARCNNLVCLDLAKCPCVLWWSVDAGSFRRHHMGQNPWHCTNVLAACSSTSSSVNPVHDLRRKQFDNYDGYFRLQECGGLQRYSVWKLMVISRGSIDPPSAEDFNDGTQPWHKVWGSLPMFFRLFLSSGTIRCKKSKKCYSPACY